MATEYFNDAWRIPNNKNQSLVSNYSMDFDGVSDVINTSFSPPLGANNRTISIWFKTGVNAFENICGYGTAATSQGFDICTHGSPSAYSIGVHAFGPAIIANGVYIPNQWNHYVVTYDGTILRGYLNGQPVNTSTIALNTGTSVDFTIGGGAYTPSNDYSGSIDQVSIFNYKLSASQVSTLYGGGTAVTNPMGLSPAPVAYYQLGDQTASNNTTEPNPPVESYLVPNNSLQNYVFQISPSGGKHISIPSITIASAATISVWVNIIIFSSATQQAVFGSSTNRLAFYQGGGFVKVLYYSVTAAGFITTDILVADFINKWHHIALVQNNGAATLYIDGVSEGPFSGGLVTPTFIYIGTSPIFNGFVSNAAIFNTALPATGTESIASLYNNGTPALDISSYNGLQRWYKLNAQDTFDGTNWTIKDYANNQDGTSVRMTSASLIQSNLQHTSGYSPYALSLDGINDYLKLNNTLNNSILFGQTSFTISAWIYLSSINTPTDNPVISNLGNNAARQSYMLRVNNLRDIEISVITTTGSFDLNPGNGSFEFDKWEHITITVENQELKCYLNGRQVGSTLTNVSGSVVNSVGEDYIGARGTGVTTQVFGGNLSNIAVWQGSAQNPVTLYNNGLPGDLTSLNPSAWWQLGSNSSFDTNWTCLNEGSLTGLDAVSVNMTNDDITNGVGYSANGLGTSSIEIVGDAPYSTANGISVNMDVLDRTTDVPS